MTPQGIPVRDPETDEHVVGTVDMFYECGHVSLSLPSGGSTLIVDPCIGQRTYDHTSEKFCGACMILTETHLYLRRYVVTMTVCTSGEDNTRKSRTHAKVNLLLGLLSAEARTISALQRFGKRFTGEIIDALEDYAEKASPDCKKRLEQANNLSCPLCKVTALFNELSSYVAAVAGSNSRYKLKIYHSLYLYLLSVAFDGRVHTRAFTEGLCLIADTDERPFDWQDATRPLYSIGHSRQ